MTPPRPGYIHPTAVIGSPPEHRDWRPGSPSYLPEIHPSAQINAFVTVDAGRLRATVIDAFVFLMAHVHIGHDCVVGRECELAAGAVIAGECVIGERVKIGVNACVRPLITIGDGARVGAGAVVVKDVLPGVTVVGNPARHIGWPTPDEEMEDLEVWKRWYEASRQ